MFALRHQYVLDARTLLYGLQGLIYTAAAIASHRLGHGAHLCVI
jgi:hypothetical protein